MPAFATHLSVPLDVQIAEPWQGVGCVTKNAVVIAPGGLDRSATGTGIAELYLDPDDPFPEGYLLSDTWPGDDVQ